MRKIVAIGGGDLASGATLAIDEWVVRLTERRSPRALFLPTASRDAESQCEAFAAIYGQALGCQVENLLVAHPEADPTLAAERIAAAELVYVGGGDTLFMLRRWRELGIDRMLVAAATAGKVLAGMSAGANCWFAYGLSDAQKYYSPEEWSYLRVRGLGLIPALGCPHYHSQGREAALENQVAQYGELAIALDDHAALVVQGERCRILKSQPRGAAYRLYLAGLEVVCETLEECRGDWALDELVARRATSQFPRAARPRML